LQTIKVALAIRLKEEMGVDNMLAREEELMDILWEGLSEIPNLHILAPKCRKRIGILSIYIDDLHYNLATRILNDRFGIQARGGCSCAGTYGHYLLHVTPEHSRDITCLIDHGDHSKKPGWLRLSIHPTMTDEEARYIVDAVRELCERHTDWSLDYTYDPCTNEFRHKHESNSEKETAERWLGTSLENLLYAVKTD